MPRNTFLDDALEGWNDIESGRLQLLEFLNKTLIQLFPQEEPRKLFLNIIADTIEAAHSNTG
ncbi:MAG: hypothetical protein HY231_19660 [Acidobacteria bacterium]|nr:hypothetical protein [Acidobacteriota bacterium]